MSWCFSCKYYCGIAYYSFMNHNSQCELLLSVQTVWVSARAPLFWFL